MNRFGLLLFLVTLSCEDSSPKSVNLDVGSNDVELDQKHDQRSDFQPDAPKDIEVDTSILLPIVTPPNLDGVSYVDVHLHCGSLGDDGLCAVSDAWSEVAGKGGMGAILSVEHWTLSFSAALIAELGAAGSSIGKGDQLNETYAATMAAKEGMIYFASVECWHDTPYGPGWLEACKEDARRWVGAGAQGFKDHVGKHWQSDSDGPEIADAGVFGGAWSRFSGDCKNVAGAITPNRDCVQSKDIRYPILTPEWRELVRYMVEDLKAPIVSHATTWYGAEAECYDPESSSLRNCGELSREHLIDFVEWAEVNVSASARKRIIIGHTGFMLPGEKGLPRDSDTPEIAEAREAAAQGLLSQLNAVLATGVSVETATLRDFVAMTYRQDPDALGACVLRDLFSKHREQLLLGTDGQIDRECIADNYRLWNDLLTGDVAVLGPVRSACSGAVTTYGIALEKTVIPECAGEVAPGTQELFLVGNFRNLYGP